MNRKEEYWRTNLLTATVVKYGRVFHLSHLKHEKQAKVLETGKYWTCGRREFRRWLKKHGGVADPMLKTGEYIDIHGQKQALWGINDKS